MNNNRTAAAAASTTTTSTTTGDSKQLRDRLLASGAQPLVGLVGQPARHRESTLDDYDDYDSRNIETNNRAAAIVDFAATNKTTKRKETFYWRSSSSSSKRSILKNNKQQHHNERHKEQQQQQQQQQQQHVEQETNNNEWYNANTTANHLRDTAESEQLLAKVSAPVTVACNSNNDATMRQYRHADTSQRHLADQEPVTLTTIEASNIEDPIKHRHHLQQQRAAVFIENKQARAQADTANKWFGPSNQSNDSDNTCNDTVVIKRSPSRISWNLDDDDDDEHKDKHNDSNNNNQINSDSVAYQQRYQDAATNEHSAYSRRRSFNDDVDQHDHMIYPIDMDKRARSPHVLSSPTPRHREINAKPMITRQSPVLHTQSQYKYRAPVVDEQQSINGSSNESQSRRYKRNNNNNNYNNNIDNNNSNGNGNANSKYYPTVITTNNNNNLASYPPPTQSMLAKSESDDLDLQDDQDPEPVYVCRCCGLACELAPSMRYLHRFKVIFFVFNFLVLLFGVANFGMGLWFRIDPKVYELHKYIQTNNYTSAGYIMLFAGFVVAITALIGFRAASKSKPGHLIYYFVMVAIITLLLMGSLVLVTVYGLGDSLERFATKEVYQQIQNKTRSDRSAQFLDFIQIKMKCCGASSFLDYANLGMNPPISCYAVNRNYVNAPGCGRAFRELFDIRAGMAAGFSAASVFVQLVAITMAAIMFCIIYHSRIPTTSSLNDHHS